MYASISQRIVFVINVLPVLILSSARRITVILSLCSHEQCKFVCVTLETLIIIIIKKVNYVCCGK